MATAPRGVVEAALGHECKVHLVLYGLLFGALTAYSLGFPFVAVFAVEHRVGEGTFVLLAAGLVGWWMYSRIYRRITAQPEVTEGLHPPPRGVRRLAVLMRRPARPPIRRLPTSASVKPFQNVLLHAQSVAQRTFTTYWEPADLRVVARVGGTADAPVLVVSGGLVAAAHRQANIVEAVMLHECAHVTHGDSAIPPVLRASVPAWIWSSVAMVALGLAHLYVMTKDDHMIYFALGLLVVTEWLLTIAFGALCLARYVGFLYSLRELMADTTAARWLGSGESYAEVLRPHVRMKSAFSGRLKSLLSIRLTHLSEIERLEFLQDDERVLQPKLRYFALTALIAVLFQSSPFLAGYGNWALIVFLTIFSCSISVALSVNVAEASRFAKKAGRPISWRKRIVLSIALAFFFHLPLVKLVGLSDFLVAPFTSGINWHELLMTNGLHLKRVLWNASWPLATVCYGTLLHLYQSTDDAVQGMRNWKARALAASAALYLALMLIVTWESVRVVEWLDALQNFLSSHEELVPLAVLLPVLAAVSAMGSRRDV